jgi:hypothetical protein
VKQVISHSCYRSPVNSAVHLFEVIRQFLDSLANDFEASNDGPLQCLVGREVLFANPPKRFVRKVVSSRMWRRYSTGETDILDLADYVRTEIWTERLGGNQINAAIAKVFE